MDDRTVKDFVPGDVVRHIFLGNVGTVRKVGSALLLVEIHIMGQEIGATNRTWRPTSVIKV